jgi:molybdate transport system ATP-binding protein
VAASAYPWEIALEPPGETAEGSPRNRLPVRVLTTTTLGNRVRVALDGPQPLAAEVTAAAAEQLGLAPGRPVVAAWKATATRLTPR